jgi:hypothetical protein
MNLIEQKYYALDIPDTFKNAPIIAAIEISICTNPEVVDPKAQTWLLLTETRLLLVLAKRGHAEIIKNIRLDSIKKLEMIRGEMAVVGLVIETGSLIEKIEGYMLGKERMLEELTEKVRAYLEEKQSLVADNGVVGNKRPWITVSRMRTFNRGLKYSLAFSLLVLILAYTIKISQNSTLMAEVNDPGEQAAVQQAETPRQTEIIVKDMSSTSTERTNPIVEEPRPAPVSTPKQVERPKPVYKPSPPVQPAKQDSQWLLE